MLSDERIASVGTAVGKALGHIGNLDMDVFVTEDAVYVLELNARFGGGYPFSHLAGVNLPKAIIKWLSGEALTDELVCTEGYPNDRYHIVCKRRRKVKVWKKKENINSPM